MALLESEIYRIRAELGYPVLTIGAEPYIEHVAIFDQVIQPYIESGAQTTSTTTVAATTDPTPSTLTLASSTGFHLGEIVIVDVDARQERVTVEAIAGSTITVLLTKAHAGSYPVTVEGGESIVRGILGRLRDADDRLLSAAQTAGLKSVGRGAVEWYGSGGATIVGTLKDLKNYHRNELAACLGVPNMRNYGSGCSSIY